MIKIQHNIGQVRRQFESFARRELTLAIRDSLNETAEDALDAIQQHMRQTFDRPTRWTLNAFWVRKAGRGNLVALIEEKTAARSRFYLKVQHRGGVRPSTGMESLFKDQLRYPGVIHGITPAQAARLNAHGNLYPGDVQRIISSVKASRDKAQNTTARSRKRNKNRAEYFVPREGSRLSPGVWKRTGRQRPVKVLHFTRSQPKYAVRFRPDQVASRTFERHFHAAFSRNLSKHLRLAGRASRVLP